MAENTNISPDMINNIVNMLKNSQDSNTENASNSDNPEGTDNTNNMQNDSMLDLETIMKIKKIMETMNNKNDPKANLLYSLKPYLRKSKQAKLDQYVNLLKISQVTNLFKNEKGETE